MNTQKLEQVPIDMATPFKTGVPSSMRKKPTRYESSTTIISPAWRLTRLRQKQESKPTTAQQNA